MRIRATVRLRNDRLIAAREALGITQAQAADLCGVRRDVYGQVERLDFRRANSRDVDRIASTFDVAIEEIMPPECAGAHVGVHHRVAEVETAALLEAGSNGHLLLPSPDEELEAIEMTEQVTDLVRGALRRLPKRESDILTMRFGLNGKPKVTLDGIGKMVGITRERVRQYESRAIRNVQAIIAGEPISDSSCANLVEEALNDSHKPLA